MDSLNALYPGSTEASRWRLKDRIAIQVLDLDARVPRLARAQLAALSVPGGPLNGLQIEFVIDLLIDASGELRRARRSPARNAAWAASSRWFVRLWLDADVVVNLEDARHAHVVVAWSRRR